MLSRWVLAALVLGFYALHHDWWFWYQAEPLFLGVLPVGLFYHACYTLAVALLMMLLIRRVWPSHLDPAKRSTSTAERSGGRRA